MIMDMGIVRGAEIEMRGGRGMVQRLSEMGFTNSTRVKVLSSSSPGPVLVGVRDARVALGRGIAMKIMVNTGGLHSENKNKRGNPLFLKRPLN
jgi:ferrous iron transport protein A